MRGKYPGRWLVLASVAIAGCMASSAPRLQHAALESRQEKILAQGIWQILYSSDGQRVAAVGLGTKGENHIVVCDADSLQVRSRTSFSRNARLVAHEGAAALSPDFRIFAEATVRNNWQYFARFYELSSGRLIATRQQPSQVYTLAFSPRASYLASSSSSDYDSAWTLYRTEGRKKYQNLMSSRRGENDGNFVSHMAFSSNESLFVAGMWDGSLKIWNTKTKRLASTLGSRISRRGKLAEKESCEVISLGFAKNNEIVVSLHGNGKLRFWNLRERMLVSERQLPNKADCMCVSSVGNLLAVGDVRGNITLYRPNGTMLRVIPTLKKQITAVCFSPNGNALAVGYADGTVASRKTEL